MQDISLSLITPFLSQDNIKILWLADENILKIPHSLSNPSLHLVTNRYDLYQEATEKKLHADFNDFDFSKLEPEHYDLIVYRVSKERPLVHYIINQSFHHLKSDGKLVLCGHNQEGIKTHIKNAEKRYCTRATLKLDKQFRTATFTKNEKEGPLLEDKSYTSLREITKTDGHTFHTKPGLFGWNKIDSGSKFLTENLSRLFTDAKLEKGPLLDLGCGYGYLSIMASTLGDFEITSTDNNAAAIAACKKNFELHKVNGSVIADDCAKGIQQRYNGIICNPPFHAGFDTSEDLTDKFLRQIHHLLKRGKSAFLVCNHFLAIEKKAEEIFWKVDLDSRNNGFKIIRLVR